MRSRPATQPTGRNMGEPTEESVGGESRRWILAGIGIGIAIVVLGGSFFGRMLLPAIEKAAPIADVSSERLLGLGSVVGFAPSDDAHAWLGIPYAEAPIHDLRWRAPQPADAWADTFDALAFGPPCVQLATPVIGLPSDDPEGLVGDEDCLYLNVWAPQRSNHPLPLRSPAEKEFRMPLRIF